MLKIRKDVFETNSSSTHCLVIKKDKLDLDINEDIFLKKYDVFAGKSEPIKKNIDGEKFIEVQDKLTYLVKIALMCMHSDDSEDEMNAAYRLINLLKEIFHNTDFSEVTYEKYDYYYEDGDYLCDSWREDAPIEKFLDKDVLKRFFLYGIAYFGNRDNEDYSDFLQYEYLNKKDDYLLVECSG